MTITAAVEASPSYSVLSKTQRRALLIILAAVARDGGSAAISGDGLAELGVKKGKTGAKVRALRAVGFISITTGAKRVNVFARCDAWQYVKTELEAQRLIAKAEIEAHAPREPKVVKARNVSGIRVTTRKRQPPAPRGVEQPERRMGFNRVVGDQPPARPITLSAVPWSTPWPQRAWDRDTTS